MTEKTNEIKTEILLPAIQELVAAGVHTGHRTSKWHPKMAPYIFSSRHGTHVFDLEKTLEKLSEALVFLSRVVANDGVILFVGTKPAARAIVREAAQALGMPYVVDRWLGGTLTNFKTIAKRIQYLKNLEEQEQTGQWEKYTKKERLELRREKEKLQKRLVGIRALAKLPEVVLATDIKMDEIAIREARKTKVPVISLCDTNMDPTAVDYLIPANDDASASLKIIFDSIVKNLKNKRPVKTADNSVEIKK